MRVFFLCSRGHYSFAEVKTKKRANRRRLCGACPDSARTKFNRRICKRIPDHAVPKDVRALAHRVSDKPLVRDPMEALLSGGTGGPV